MDYANVTPESLKAEMLAQLADTVEVREGSYANTLLSPAAYQLYKIYQMVMPTVEMAIDPDETAGDIIDKRAADFGIERIPGNVATVYLKFTSGFLDRTPVVPAGTRAETLDGLRFVTTEDAVFQGQEALVPARAEAAGRRYNVDANTITVMTRNIGGVSAVTNPEGASGGTDEESDAALLERYRNHLRRPVSSGNVNHYIQWATEVSGVVYARVEPLWDGPGTVRVVIAGPDKSAVDELVRQACADHIEEERPIGADVTVISTTALSVDVEAQVALTEGGSAQAVQAQFETAMRQLLASYPFGEAGTVRYSRVLSLLLGCDGVEEYVSLKLNGGAANVPFTAQLTPMLGSVTVTAAGG